MKRNPKMRVIAASLALALCSMVGIGQVRTDADAIQIAREFLEQHSIGNSSLQSVPLKKVAQAADEQSIEAPSLQDLQNGDGIHIITDAKNHSFVLVSGDQRMQPILGYSFGSEFNVNNIAPGLIDLIAGYQRAFNRLQYFNAEFKVPESRSTTAVEPLIKTKWNQEFPYNMYCPKVGENTAATGCVATAMAQVLKYYGMPYSATGYIAYETEKSGYINADLSSIPLYWSDMVNVYDDNSTQVQNEAVAHLMQACGYSVYMEYNSPESSAYSQNIPYALINNYGYNKNITYKERDYYTSDEWLSMIDTEIDASRPILYNGVSGFSFGDQVYTLGGHEFILDGRDTQGMYHFNFGWSGVNDGYYTLDAINPSGSEYIGYNYDQAMVMSVSPETFGKHEDIFYASEFSFSSLNAYNTSQLVCDMAYYCYSSDAQTYTILQGKSFKGEVGVGLFDDNFNFIKSLYSSWTDLQIGQGRGGTVTIKLDKNTFTNGSSYLIALYAKGSNSNDVTPMRTPGGTEDWYRATTQNDKVTLTLLGLPEPIVLTTGNYKALAYDAAGKEYKWQMSIRKDDNEVNKYWLNDIDPIVSAKGYSYDNGWNKVYGILNNTGTRLTISGNQIVGENILLRSMGSTDDITFVVSSEGNTLTATEAWGSFCSGEALSTYTNTELVYGILPPEVVDNPIIVWDQQSKTATISTTTEYANIYYTLDGRIPTTASTLFTKPISIDHNCEISAIAEKNGLVSDVKKFNVNTFTVDRPVIDSNDNFVYLTCATADATIYYTLDGSNPTKRSTVYTAPVEINKTMTVKAFATKDDFNDSSIAEKTVIGPDPDPAVVENNVAGKLNERIDGASKLTLESLTISGDLNGTDIKYIREMLNDGNLSTLILTDANIVSGGGHYYESSVVGYDTEDNVVGSFMFYSSKKLVTLKLPNSVKSIDMFGVSDNDNLLEVVLPTSCEELKDNSLSYNKRLPMVTLPQYLNEFSAKVFTSCNNLADIYVDLNNSYFTSVDGVLFSKDMSRLVWYSPCRDNVSYSIPTGVTTLGEGCFSKSRLKSVEMPEGLRTIEYSAFSDCENLSAAIFPSTLTEIGMFAFSECGLLNIDLVNVSKVESNAFQGNKSLSMVHVGKRLKSLSSTAFNRCLQLKDFDVDDDNEYFSAIDGVLFDKTQRTLKKFPTAKVATVYAVPSTVEVIDDYSFLNCSNVRTVIIATSVERIGASAFSYSKCESIKMESNSNVSKIDMFAFDSCEDLQSLIIPDQVEVIPSSCASGCISLEYLRLPASIKEIEISAFSRCKNLNTIESKIVDMSQVQLDKNYNGEYSSFAEINPNCLWEVPYGSSTSYTSCPWWVGTWKICENSVGISDAVFTTKCTIDICDGGVEISSPVDNTLLVFNIDGTLVYLNKV